MSDPIGFPLRPLRDAFGPLIKNRYPVRSPEYELDGALIGNLLMAQVVGAGLTAALLWMLVKIQSGAPHETLLWRDEAWNPTALSTGAYAPPGLVRASAGVVDITYPAQVPDWQGTLRNLTLSGGVAAYVDDNANPLFARVVPDAVPSSHVKVRAWLIGAGSVTPTDGTLLIGLV